MAEQRILVLNGPNLNLLGTREPDVYGTVGLRAIERDVTAYAADRGLAVTAQQSNHEGALVDALHDAADWAVGVVLNPGGYTHTSVALRDAISATGLPVVEVHLSNTAAREPFRQRSLTAPVAIGVVAGFGGAGYRLAVDGLLAHLADGGNGAEGEGRDGAAGEDVR